MTPEQIKDEIAKIRDIGSLIALENFCARMRETMDWSVKIREEYEITLTRKKVKEEDLPDVENPTHDVWSWVFTGHGAGSS